MKPCGTYSAWRRHYLRKEVPCEPCKEAKKEWALNYYHSSVKNKEKILSHQREYYKNNKELSSIKKRKRRALKYATRTERYTAEDVINKYGTICHICSIEIDMDAPRITGHFGWEKGLHLDHLIPLAQGGTDTLDNIRPAHGVCNISKGGRVKKEKSKVH